MLATYAGGAEAGSLDEPFVVDGRPLPEFNPTQAPYFQWRDAKAAATSGEGVYFFEKDRCSARDAVRKVLAECRKYFPELCKLQAIGMIDVSGSSEAVTDAVADEYQRRLTTAGRSSAALSGELEPAILMGDALMGLDGAKVAKADLGRLSYTSCTARIAIDVIGGPTCSGFAELAAEAAGGHTPAIGTMELHCSNGDDLVGRSILGLDTSVAKLRDQAGHEVRMIWGYDLWCRTWEHADFDVVINCPEEPNYEQLSQTFRRSNFIESWTARMEFLRQQFKIDTPERLFE